MTGQAALQVLSFFGAAVVGSIGTWKIVDELLRKGKASLKDDYRFAREFLPQADKNDLHPVVAEMGYQALAGDAKISADEVSYLLTLKHPRDAIRSFIAARRLLDFFTTAPLEKIAFRRAYALPARRNTLRYAYAAAYFSTYTLGISSAAFGVNEASFRRHRLDPFLSDGFDVLPYRRFVPEICPEAQDG